VEALARGSVGGGGHEDGGASRGCQQEGNRDPNASHATIIAPSGAHPNIRVMRNEKCNCEKPLLIERSEQKGSSDSWCGRCKRPLTLRPASFRSAFA